MSTKKGGRSIDNDILTGLVEIRPYVFECCSFKDTKLALPDTLRKIGSNSFVQCNMEIIVIPGSVKIIEDWAFYSCDNLRDITIENGVEYISDRAFHKTAISSIKIPESVRFMGLNAFSGCKNLKEIQIPSSLKIFEDKDNLVFNFKSHNIDNTLANSIVYDAENFEYMLNCMESRVKVNIY